MLKYFLTFSLLLILSVNVYSQVPEQVSNYIDLSVKKTTFMELTPPDDSAIPDSVSSKQALEDAIILRYLFDNAYAGYSYWSKRQPGITGISSEIEKLASNSSKVSTNDIYNVICKGISAITDGHVTIGFRQNNFTPYRHRNAYFADLVIEKRAGKYIVAESKVAGIKPGSKYSGDESMLFPTLAPEGSACFLVGTLSVEKIYDINISVNNKPVKVPVHRCRMATANPGEGNVFSKYTKNEVPVLRLANMYSSENDSIFRRFEAEGNTLRNCPLFIMNLIHNSGGNSVYYSNFIANLNGNNTAPMLSAIRNSPAIAQSWTWIDTAKYPAFRSYFLEGLKLTQQQKENPISGWSVENLLDSKLGGQYKGKMILLTNSNNMSSAEMAIAQSRCLQNVVVVGENSGGVLTFGNVRNYMLKNSHIRLSLPYCLYYYPTLVEGEGLKPDLWLDTDEPVEETMKWITEGKKYRFSPKPDTLPPFEGFENPSRLLPLYWNLVKVKSPVDGNISNRIMIDSTDKSSGRYSLLMESDSLTNSFNAIVFSLPTSFPHLKAALDFKGQFVVPADKPTACSAGFILTDLSGRREMVMKNFDPAGRWTKFEVNADLTGKNYLAIQFVIKAAGTGQLRIDNLAFSKD